MKRFDFLLKRRYSRRMYLNSAFIKKNIYVYSILILPLFSWYFFMLHNEFFPENYKNLFSHKENDIETGGYTWPKTLDFFELKKEELFAPNGLSIAAGSFEIVQAGLYELQIFKRYDPSISKNLNYSDMIPGFKRSRFRTEYKYKFALYANHKVIYHRGHFFILVIVKYKPDISGEIEYNDFHILYSKTGSAFGEWSSCEVFSTNGEEDSASNYFDFPGLAASGKTIIVTATRKDSKNKKPDDTLLLQINIDSLTKCENGGKYSNGQPINENIPAYTQPVMDYDGQNSKGPGYLVYARPESKNENTIELWKFQITYSTDAKSGLPAFKKYTFKIDPFDSPPHAPQAYTDIKLSALDSRIMNAVKRNNAIWAVQTIKSPYGNAGIRVLKFMLSDSGEPEKLDHVDINDPKKSFFVPSITADGNGNAVLVYNASSPDSFPSVAYTVLDNSGRNLNKSKKIGYSDTSLPFMAVYNRNTDKVSFWADYNGASIDPLYGNRVWVNGAIIKEYKSIFGPEAGWTSVIGQIETQPPGK